MKRDVELVRVLECNSEGRIVMKQQTGIRTQSPMPKSLQSVRCSPYYPNANRRDKANEIQIRMMGKEEGKRVRPIERLPPFREHTIKDNVVENGAATAHLLSEETADVALGIGWENGILIARYGDECNNERVYGPQGICRENDARTEDVLPEARSTRESLFIPLSRRQRHCSK